MSAERVAEVLAGAALWLDGHEWRQQHGHCVLRDYVLVKAGRIVGGCGAIAIGVQVLGDDAQWLFAKRPPAAAQDTLIREAHRLTGLVIEGGTLMSFNDTPGRTKADVADVLKRAAELALRDPIPLPSSPTEQEPQHAL